MRVTNPGIEWLCGAVAMLALGGCANMGAGPQGGIKDVTPPRYVNSTPRPGQTGYDGNKITVSFDEYITLKDAYNTVVVTPPQKTPFSVSSLGRKVTVELMDTLRPNTTYVIDFGNSIADNNEGNTLENYSISFSTGDKIDSFQIAGTVLNAETLEPMKGVLVGAYSGTVTDSTFVKDAMQHIGKTDEKGYFRIKGLKQLPFRVFALKDNNSNYMFDDKSEAIAVIDESVTPTCYQKTVYDTVYAKAVGTDSLVVDTVKERRVAAYLPDSLVMFMFQEELHRQYFKKAVRDEKQKFTLFFENERKELPVITPLNFVSSSWLLPEPSVTGDTLNYWIADSMVANMDTIRFAIDYLKTDSAGQFVPQRDTVQLLSRKWEKKKKDKGPSFTLASAMEIDDSPKIEFSMPLAGFGRENMKVQQKVNDSTWSNVDFELRPVNDNPRAYWIDMNMEEKKDYRVKIDSAAIKDIAGRVNKDSLRSVFRKRGREEYASLTMVMENAPAGAVVEILNANERVVRRIKATSGRVKAEHLKGGDYYVKLIDDTDGNGLFTTGSYASHKKPENVYFYGKKINLRANWDREEDWNVTGRKITEQRPADLKPKQR